MPQSLEQISAVREELLLYLTGARVDKIEQPERHVIILTTKNKSNTVKRLLISVSSSDTRTHLTDHKFENPPSPPMFCMLLRKYLTGARITEIRQPPAERILEILFKTSSALGDSSEKRMIIELFGRVPNVILTDENDVIIDCLRRISGDMQGKRILLPSLRYYPPVSHDISDHKSRKAADDDISNNKNISKELDETYTRKAKNDSVKRRSSTLLKAMRTIQKRILRKLEVQKAELNETAGREYLRQCGELITANIHKMKKGEQILLAQDYYLEDNNEREIKLDINKTPQENAAKYFKAYVKARNAERFLTQQIELGERELEYIESVIDQIIRAVGEQELEEIRSELAITGYYREKSRKKTKKHELKPHTYISSSGLKIFAGKNNIQNDKLTFKTAFKTDIWLHAQKIHGAHVIVSLEGKMIDDTTLNEAATVAAYHSAARYDSKVPVDYTQVKFVKKQSGQRPGMVLYTDFKTIQAANDEELVSGLKQ